MRGPIKYIGGAVVGAVISVFYMQASEKVAVTEGGYSNDPRDSGGETMLGVTKEVARAAGYKGKMADLTPTYKDSLGYFNYWRPLHLDHISGADSVYFPVALRLYHVSYNMGPGRAGGFLQFCLNTMNLNACRYPDVTVDGAVGRKTLEAFDKFRKQRGKTGEVALRMCIMGLQLAYYASLTQRRPKDEAYAVGWYLNTHELNIEESPWK